MKYMAIIDADEKPVSCEFIGCNGNVAPYRIGTTDNIKVLNQEPCEDAISRQAVLDHIYGINGLEGFKNSNVFEKHYADFIKALPPVTPQPKMGHWIEHDTGHSIYFDCSLCSCVAPYTETADKILWKLSNYCPNCGAKMQEVEEK